mmetsp:Transcript_22644/g.35221  ORF Transcript_22644/g.35221 Transcript_22644/m.35221 type:complete len:428 (+) Transcript_22644:100-1383(+)
MRIRNEHIVTTMNDIGSLSNSFEFIDVKQSHFVDSSAGLAIVSLNNFKSLSNRGSSERVGTSSKSNTRSDIQRFHNIRIGNDVSSRRRQRLRENTANKVASTIHIKVFFNSVSSSTNTSKRVSFIHNNPGIILVAQLSGSREVGNGTISRVDSINNQQGPSLVFVSVLLHKLTQGFVILMREGDDLSTGQFTTISQADVALLVHENHSTLRTQVSDQVHASQKSRSGEAAIFTFEKVGHSLIGLFNNQVLSQQQIATVIPCSGLSDSFESILSHLIINMEGPVRERRHENTLMIITFKLNVDTISALIISKSRKEGPVFVHFLRGASFRGDRVNNGLGELRDRFMGQFSLCNGVFAFLLEHSANHIQVSESIHILTIREQFLGQFVKVILLFDSFSLRKSNQGSREGDNQTTQPNVGEEQIIRLFNR